VSFLKLQGAGKLLLKHVQKLISPGNTEIPEEIKVFRASVANIMLRHAQKEEELSEKVKSDFPGARGYSSRFFIGRCLSGRGVFKFISQAEVS